MLFNINKRSPLPVNTLLTIPVLALRGIAIQESAAAGQGELADGTKAFAGFMTRDSQPGGPVLGDVIYPGRLELPTASTEEGSLEYAVEYEAEGPDYVDAGITAATPLNSLLSFKDGKTCVAAPGKHAVYELVELMAPEIAGNVRIRARLLQGVIKA